MLSPKIVKWACHIFTDIIHRTKYVGLENIEKDKLYVFAANHVSASDPVMVMNVVNNLSIMAKSELFEIPVISYFVKSANAIPIKRGKNDFGGVIHAANEIRDKKRSLLIFPEGTRHAAKKNVKAKDGAVCIARAAGVEVIPVYICEKKGFLKKYLVKFGKPLDVSKPIENEDNDKKSIKHYTKIIMEEIYSMRD